VHKSTQFHQNEHLSHVISCHKGRTLVFPHRMHQSFVINLL